MLTTRVLASLGAMLEQVSHSEKLCKLRTSMRHIES
jgi:hypothetical protein